MEIKSLLHHYAQVSGQTINFTKSAVVFGYIPASQTRTQLSQLLDIPNIGKIGLYLGLPDFQGRSLNECFSYLLEKVNTRLKDWTTRFLNQAGKETLIKAIIQAIPTYAMSCFRMPSTLLDKIEQKIRNFWWTSKKDNRALCWLKWSKVAVPKFMGGMGFKNLQDFNTALLAKQVWRLLTKPHHLLTRILKAKYFKNCSILDSITRKSSSFGWKSIHSGISLIKSLYKRGIGPGSSIQIWREKWTHSKPCTTIKPSSIHSQLEISTPSQLMIPHTRTWDQERVMQLVHKDDVIKVLSTRPSQFASSDKFIWPDSVNGQYTVQQGYNLLQSIKQQTNAPSTSSPQIINFLCKKLWSFKIPPKLRVFWWKLIHNGLPTFQNLQRKGIPVDNTCFLCQESMESVFHLFTTCRVTKEIWSLLIPSAISSRHLSHLDFIEHLWSNEGKGSAPVSIFIGWQIWKARNALVFNNKREPIPIILQQVMVDHQTWLTTRITTSLQREPTQYDPEEQSHPLQEQHKYNCYVDASWITDSTPMGMGWVLIDNETGRETLTGMGSAQPTATPGIAEAAALYQACVSLSSLGYNDVLFLTDSRVNVNILRKLMLLRVTGTIVSAQEITSTPMLEDIYSIAMLPTVSFEFQHITRAQNHQADQLAKQGRISGSNLHIKWSVM